MLLHKELLIGHKVSVTENNTSRYAVIASKYTS